MDAHNNNPDAMPANDLTLALTGPYVAGLDTVDPTTFDIDRYERPRAEHLRSGAYSPYGRGQHTCLGKSLVDVQMLITMARLFHRLDLELDRPDYTLATRTAPTPGPSKRFKVRVKGYRN